MWPSPPSSAFGTELTPDEIEEPLPPSPPLAPPPAPARRPLSPFKVSAGRASLRAGLSVHLLGLVFRGALAEVSRTLPEGEPDKQSASA